jgi:pimeloyl-ACP methyl ester carboxylesterase
LSAQCPRAEEAQAAKFVVETLEGGPLPVAVPGDWREKVKQGEVVAQAVKAWQMENHAGHAASVVGVFRDGGVMDNDELFVKARALGIPSLVVLGEKDGLSTEEEIKDFGFEVEVVPGAGHAVVRENAGEVAGLISRFWKGV